MFRIVALFFAGFIMANEWVKFLGAFYLIHLMADHFSALADESADDTQANKAKVHAFWPTVIAIQLMDLSLSCYHCGLTASLQCKDSVDHRSNSQWCRFVSTPLRQVD